MTTIVSLSEIKYPVLSVSRRIVDANGHQIADITKGEDVTPWVADALAKHIVVLMNAHHEAMKMDTPVEPTDEEDEDEDYEDTNNYRDREDCWRGT